MMCWAYITPRLGDASTRVMSCVYFPIVLTYLSALSYIIMICLSDFPIRHHDDQPSVISSSYSAGKALQILLSSLPNLTPMLSTDDILLVSSSLLSHLASCHLPSSTCIYMHGGDLTWCEPTLHGPHISPDMGPRWDGEQSKWRRD